MPRRSATARAFSIMEIMVVLVIIGVMMTVVAFNFGSFSTKGKTRATKTTLEYVRQALQSYQLDYNSYPPALQYLITTKILDETKPLRDGWSRDLFYAVPGLNDRPYVLLSTGEDGTAGTADDIDSWSMNR